MKKVKELLLSAALVTMIVLPGVATIEFGNSEIGIDLVNPLDKGDRGEQFL